MILIMGTGRRSTEMPWWGAILVFVPLYLGVAFGIGLALVLLATRGHWGWFWSLVGVEAYAVIASIAAYREGKRRRRAANRR